MHELIFNIRNYLDQISSSPLIKSIEGLGLVCLGVITVAMLLFCFLRIKDNWDEYKHKIAKVFLWVLIVGGFFTCCIVSLYLQSCLLYFGLIFILILLIIIYIFFCSFFKLEVL